MWHGQRVSLLNEAMQRERDLLVIQFASCKTSREDLYNHERRLEHMILAALEQMEKRLMKTLDDIQQDVADEATVVGSVVTLLNNLSQQLKDAGNDPAKIQAIIDQVDANKKALADAVVANTPAATPAP